MKAGGGGKNLRPTGSTGSVVAEPAASSASRHDRSSAPSHCAIAMVATPLPMMFVKARASLINRSMPKINARPKGGIWNGTEDIDYLAERDM
jgi:hypothetical protein